jgi:hypothetical protein
VDGRTRNGDIVTDYGLSISGDESKTVNGKIGSGSVRIQLSTDVGDLRIKKGPAFPSAPETPSVPRPPAAPNAPKLKTSRALPPQPVTQ